MEHKLFLSEDGAVIDVYDEHEGKTSSNVEDDGAVVKKRRGGNQDPSQD